MQVELKYCLGEKKIPNIYFWKCGNATFLSLFPSLPHCHVYHGTNSCQRVSGWVTAFEGSTPLPEMQSSSSATRGLCWHQWDQNPPFCLPFSWSPHHRPTVSCHSILLMVRCTDAVYFFPSLAALSLCCVLISSSRLLLDLLMTTRLQFSSENKK